MTASAVHAVPRTVLQARYKAHLIKGTRSIRIHAYGAGPACSCARPMRSSLGRGIKARMPTIRIDNREVRVSAGSTILEAARKLGIEIPTLCHMEGFGVFTSCMVCLVEESVSERLLPSCSAPVSHGMVIETNNERVREARRDMLELLLREHVGDCESPCMRACPVHLDIPAILKRIRAGSEHIIYDEHANRVPLISVLAHICPAPCEKACRRRIHDEAVSIRLAMRTAAAHDFELNFAPRSNSPHFSGTKVAIIGAGPAQFLTTAPSRAELSVMRYRRNVSPGASSKRRLTVYVISAYRFA
jgi:hypothetical protein